uniref:Secreted protein n=1 Tax=Panagrellus redivivus TaxID=6233 RepID=A0A7E4ZQ18_PANRE
MCLFCCTSPVANHWAGPPGGPGGDGPDTSGVRVLKTAAAVGCLQAMNLKAELSPVKLMSGLNSRPRAHSKLNSRASKLKTAICRLNCEKLQADERYLLNCTKTVRITKAPHKAFGTFGKLWCALASSFHANDVFDT